jgi:CRISPR-associated protein Cas5d
MKIRSSVLAIRARGPLALFTEPAFKVERVSYPIITPSAARGLLEAILWKPAMHWRIRRVRVLAPIRFTAFRRNEVNVKAPMPSAAVIANGGEYRAIFADDDSSRAQRNSIALRDVDYVIEADFALTERAGSDDSVAKFEAMFERRVEKGQHFHQPYLGCREFAADVGTADDAPRPIQESRDLGMLLWDIVHDDAGSRPVFFPARLDDGVMDVPEQPEGAPQ